VKIFIFFLLSYFINCATMKFHNGNLQKPVSYHDEIGEKLSEFEDTYTNWYWFGLDIWGNQEFDKAIEDKFKEYPSAKGIRKFRFRVYNRSYYYPSAIPNPTSFITWHLNYFGYFLGITNKGIYIKGEIYK
jgi:hypothetical protein